jgi:hypothetical protein
MKRNSVIAFVTLMSMGLAEKFKAVSEASPLDPLIQDSTHPRPAWTISLGVPGWAGITLQNSTGTEDK